MRKIHLLEAVLVFCAVLQITMARPEPGVKKFIGDLLGSEDAEEYYSEPKLIEERGYKGGGGYDIGYGGSHGGYGGYGHDGYGGGYGGYGGYEQIDYGYGDDKDKGIGKWLKKLFKKDEEPTYIVIHHQHKYHHDDGYGKGGGYGDDHGYSEYGHDDYGGYDKGGYGKQLKKKDPYKSSGYDSYDGGYVSGYDGYRKR